MQKRTDRMASPHCDDFYLFLFLSEVILNLSEATRDIESESCVQLLICSFFLPF